MIRDLPAGFLNFNRLFLKLHRWTGGHEEMSP